MNNKMPAKGGSASGGKTQINIHLVSHLKIFSKAFSALIFSIGFLAFCGWQFDIEIFKKIAPSLPVIAPNTAMAFALIGLGIFFLPKLGENRKLLRMAVGFFSLFIAFLGVLTLIEYIFGLNLGIDNLFFAGQMGDNIVRMSPQSALNFLLVGLALFFYSLKEKKFIIWGQSAVLVAGITALVSLFGFIYGVVGLYTITPYKGMAVHAAAAFVLAFFAILTIHPEIGFMKIFVGQGLSGLAARRLFLALAAIGAIEILAMLAERAGIFNLVYESLIHLLIVAGVFVFLIFYSFRSLDKLAEAEKTLEHLKEIDKAKTEFVSLASHQLRTPLTSVSWFSEMLLGQEIGALNPRQRDYLMEIYSQNRRMIELVDDLLNTSRIDMGMLPMEPRFTDLKETLEEVIKELDPLMAEKNLEVSREIEADFLGAEVDPELARIIFENLLTNAVKYTPPKGKITVSLAQTGLYANIKIADTGCGIPRRQQNRIFTKMFRADNVRNKVTDGTGLGLYIVKAIVRQSGGKIHFQSEEDRGTTFFISLPTKKWNKNISEKKF